MGSYSDMLMPFMILVLCIKVLKFFVKKIHPFYLSFLMKAVHSKIPTLKEKLFEEAFKEINTGSERLEILEIGIGTGENFRNYPKNTNLTILDKTNEFLPFLQKSIDENKRNDLKISKLVINQAENMRSILSNSMDAVVHTFVLCSVKDSEMVLDEINRILKPGGVCIFIEHSLNKKLCKKFLQKTFEAICGDCTFLDMKRLLEKSNIYDKLTIKYHEIGTWFPLISILNPILYGYGKKVN